MTRIIETNRVIDPESELHTLFAEMHEGYKVQLVRKEPFWADGSLGTYEWSADEPISLEWVRNQFGGRKLQIKVIGPDNEYKGSRTVKFPDPPREHGIELVQGPTGEPIPITVAQSRGVGVYANNNEKPRDNYNQDRTLEIMQTMMAAQSTQAQAMNDMLLKRVSSLEDLLTKKLNEEPKELPQQNYLPPPDPHAQVRQTLETIKLMDDLRDAVSQKVEDSDNEDKGVQIYEKIAEKMIDKLVTTEKKTETQTPPPIPQPQTSSGPQPTTIPDDDFLREAQIRLSNMPHDQRITLAKQLLGDDFIFEEPDDFSRQKNDDSIESMLSEEDKNILNKKLDSDVSDTPTSADIYSAHALNSKPSTL